jgi:putative membrane protein
MTEGGKTTDYLANERTFLAWIRTSIAVISLGFVVAKFSVWLRELAARINPQVPIRSTGASLRLGVAMMAFGSVLAVLALLHYRAAKRAIARGELGGSDRLIIGVAIVVALLGALMIAYMLSAAQHL